MLRALSTVLLLFAHAQLKGGETHHVVDAGEFNRSVSAAKPGDPILVAPGDYGNTFHFRGVRGMAKEPIVIAAADPAKPPRFIGKTAPLRFASPSYLELRDLVISGSSGNGLNIDDGGDPDKPAHHITLRHLHIHDIGPRGNLVSIKLSGVGDFVVENCTVERWGSGHGP